MRLVDRDDFAAHVAAHLGVTTQEADRASEIVLSAFAGWLSPSERQLFVAELPRTLCAVVEQTTGSLQVPVEERLVALGLTVGHAREAVASVCHVLGEELSDDVLARLQHAVPNWIAAYLVRPAADTGIATSQGARRHDTLAEGHPGSDTPISEARTDRTQHDSVAAENPHGDEKLSTATGTTQEREQETFAEGHPATRPISTSRG